MDEKKYQPSQVEAKWQKIWESENLYATLDLSGAAKGDKKYILDMFPYPSGAGLHVGHMEGYVGTDVIARYLRMKGNRVLHPMGWDAFGLPAENYAIKTGVSPDKTTHENIDNFRRQLKLLGLSYDWSKELDTSSPEYYKWTQWIFIQLFKAGLAYKKKAPVNWCPKDETVLANEQVVDGVCDRCGTEVIQKELEQWFFKITAYADKLIEGLDHIDWLEEVKVQQKNWIGRKEGLNIHHKVVDSDLILDAFTAYPAWIFADTFLVVAPEHPAVSSLIKGSEFEKEVADFVEVFKKNKSNKSTKLDEKLGIFTGRYVIDPLTGEKMPVWLANFALMEFGTGIIRCSCHDPRDFEFAMKYKIPLKEVVVGGIEGKINAHNNEGVLVNSGQFNGQNVIEVIPKICDWVVQQGYGEKKISYHIRDWLISRQRYWGAPIPMIYCEKCGWNPVPEEQLPVHLPTDVDFKPTGESPIARSKTFQQNVTCPKCSSVAKREVDTMDTYVDSSWYFLRFVDTQNGKEFASAEKLSQWLPVDIYVGGGHVVQHLLFARFFWKALSDLKLIPKELGDEPFLKLRAPGWILGPDSRKMSKRWGNVITPEEVVSQFGADTMRTYEMFMGPFEVIKPWSVGSVAGVHRFLNRIVNLFSDNKKMGEVTASDEVIKALNRLILKVGNDIEEFKFNTAISAMMQFVNVVTDEIKKEPVEKKNGNYSWNEVFMKFLLVLAPFAPHITEELYQEMQGKTDKFSSIHKQSWPESDSKYLADSKAKVAISINGKSRGIMEVEKSITQDELVSLAKKNENIAKYLAGQEIKKVVFVPGKILNFVI